MHQDGFHANAFHEGDIGENVFNILPLFHGASAKLDDNDGIPEILDIGKGLNENISFSDGALHQVIYSALMAT